MTRLQVRICGALKELDLHILIKPDGNVMKVEEDVHECKQHLS